MLGASLQCWEVCMQIEITSSYSDYRHTSMSLETVDLYLVSDI